MNENEYLKCYDGRYHSFLIPFFRWICFSCHRRNSRFSVRYSIPCLLIIHPPCDIIDFCLRRTLLSLSYGTSRILVKVVLLDQASNQSFNTSACSLSLPAAKATFKPSFASTPNATNQRFMRTRTESQKADEKGSGWDY